MKYYSAEQLTEISNNSNAFHIFECCLARAKAGHFSVAFFSKEITESTKSILLSKGFRILSIDSDSELVVVSWK